VVVLVVVVAVVVVVVLVLVLVVTVVMVVVCPFWKAILVPTVLRSIWQYFTPSDFRQLITLKSFYQSFMTLYSALPYRTHRAHPYRTYRALLYRTPSY